MMVMTCSLFGLLYCSGLITLQVMLRICGDNITFCIN